MRFASDPRTTPPRLGLRPDRFRGAFVCICVGSWPVPKGQAATRWPALYFAFYNFCRIHKTLKVTPAVAAGITDRLWSLDDIAERIEAKRPQPGQPRPYKKRAA